MFGNKGFTLIEVLVVVVIMGILVAIATPQVVGWIRNAQYKEAAQTALSALRRAKGQAINFNQRVRVDYNLVTNAVTINIVDGDTIFTDGFKAGIVVKGGEDCDSTTSPISITFNPNGSSGSGYLCILDGATKKYLVGVASANTGRILLQKWNGSTWQAMP